MDGAVWWARLLEWVAISSSRGSSPPMIEPGSHVSCIGRQILYQEHHGDPKRDSSE